MILRDSNIFYNYKLIYKNQAVSKKIIVSRLWPYIINRKKNLLLINFHRNLTF